MAELSPFRADDTRPLHRRAGSLAGQLAALARLPRPVARFYLRALWTASRRDDKWSLDTATRPRELAPLLALARDRRRVVELGTGTGWTTLALALADSQRRVWSYDVVARPQCEHYLALVPDRVRGRVELIEREPAAPRPEGELDLLFIDSSHEREETAASFREWEPRLAPGGLAAFHDYGDPAYPGVKAGVDDLGLDGEVRGSLFAWVKPR